MQFKLICCQKSRSYYSIIKSVIYAAPSFHNSKLSILSIKLDSYPLLSIASSVEPAIYVRKVLELIESADIELDEEED